VLKNQFYDLRAERPALDDGLVWINAFDRHIATAAAAVWIATLREFFVAIRAS
jgi:hypothetical protein